MGEGRPARKADNLTAICEPIVHKMWEPQHLTTLWVSTARYRDTFTPTFIGRSPLSVLRRTDGGLVIKSNAKHGKNRIAAV
jgi:hypothetical protein